MVLCACFKPSARYEPDVEDTAPPQTATHGFYNGKQAPDAPPAAAASMAGRTVGKAAVDQSSTRDTHAEADRKSPVKAVPSPRPAMDAPTSTIWEKLASHEIMNLSPTPEPQHPTADRGASAAGVAGHLTPDLTITGTGIKPLPYDSRVAAAAGSASGSPAGAAASRSAQASKKPWGARSVPGSSNGGSDANNATTPPRRSSSSSGGGAARKPGSAATTQPSAGVPASLLKPTAASVARAQATSRPRHEESVWKH